MKTVYPVILKRAREGGYIVHVPDLCIDTQGENLADAIYMARDAISMWGVCEQDEGRTIPEAKDLSPAHAVNETVTLVDVDFDAYRRALDNRTVRKNVTIPSWLNDLAVKNGVNFSQVLQEGLRSRLGDR